MVPEQQDPRLPPVVADVLVFADKPHKMVAADSENVVVRHDYATAAAVRVER